MGWPIPAIPEQVVLPRPRYGVWLSILAAMSIVGLLLTLFIGDISDYGQLILYGAVPALLLWMCFFGARLNRYQQSLASAHAWNMETQQTKTEWQQWSRRQLAIVASVVLTPEEHGIAELLDKQGNIPMYPQKARPLFGPLLDLSAHLTEVNQGLEHQCPGYRHHLRRIYLLHTNPIQEKTIIKAVTNRWGLLPERVATIEDIPQLQQQVQCNELFLLLCLQHWPNHTPQKSSEFISAQLITSPAFAHTQSLPIMAGMGRIMPLETGKLVDDLVMLFDYNQIDNNKLPHIWLAGETENTALDIATFTSDRKLDLPNKWPLHRINLSFGPAGELSFALSLAMLAEAISRTEQDQLVICQEPQQPGWLCLLTRELFDE